MNQELNKIIRAIEPSLTVFILVFQTGLLYFQSFFADPDNPLASGTTPLDGLLSLIQILIYLIILVLLVFRWQSCLSLALKNPFIWLLATLTVVSCLWSEWAEVSLRKGIVTLQTTYFGLYFASRYTLKEQLKLLVWAMAIVVLVSALFCAAFPGVAIEVGGNAGALRGPFAQKNPFARLMVLAAIAFFVEALSNRRLKFFTLGFNWFECAVNCLGEFKNRFSFTDCLIFASSTLQRITAANYSCYSTIDRHNNYCWQSGGDVDG